MDILEYNADDFFKNSRPTTIADDVRREHCGENYRGPQTTREWLGRMADANELSGQIL